MPQISTQTAICAIIVSSFLLAFSMFKSKKWDARGQHCYITGGSSGLGLALAILLTEQGAHVSIVARDETKLKEALAKLEAARISPTQILRSYSYSLADAESSEKALDAAIAEHDIAPDAVFLCAGASRPYFFIEETEETMRKGMDNSYWVQAWTALAATKRMARDNVHGKIVFVSSFLGYMSMVGYSTYAPGKWAVRGLAETLRSELILYNISTHIFFPGTIFSPGYEEENKTKPKVTLKIEETDGGQQPETLAVALIKGIQRGDFHITADLLGNIFRASTRGASPSNHFLTDIMYGFFGWIGLPIWMRSVDSTVRGHKKEHQEYLAQKGFKITPLPANETK